MLGVCVHIDLCNFVFPYKIELHTIIPIFVNTLIPCLTSEWFELWNSVLLPTLILNVLDEAEEWELWVKHVWSVQEMSVDTGVHQAVKADSLETWELAEI